MKYCGMCGTRLTRMCPHCGLTSPLDYRFCGHCGLAFEGGSRLEQPSREVTDSTPTPGEKTPVGEAIHPPSQMPSPSPSAQPTTPTIIGERRPATIIIADVKGSTDLMEQIGTEAWVEVMNRVLQILAAEVTRFGGEVDQFRGDGLVALFGVKSAHEDDPERALLAALSMQRSFKAYAADLAEREGIDLLLRVGVNTGEVIAANIGDRSQHSEDTAMGGAIAVAARMESAAEPGTVLVSQNTYRLVEMQFEWEPLGEINVKGISNPVVVYRPLRPRAEFEQLQRLQTFDPTPMIGRVEEFKALRGSIDDLQDERGGVLLLSGERGMGKSFLVAQVRQDLIRRDALLATTNKDDLTPSASVTWLHGRCRSYYQSWPYSMWIDLIRSWLGMLPEQPDEEIGEHLQHQTKALWRHQPVDVDQILVDFPAIIEEAFSQSGEYLNAEEPRQRFFQAVRSWLQAMARRGPVVLDFGDMQWADRSSLDLLKYCLPLCDQESILWLLVFRPDRASPVWEFSHFVETEYPHRLTSITLPPLDEVHSEKFIARMIGPGVLPEETHNLILSKAEGNPYFIRELIHSLMSQGVLVRDENGKWHSTRAVDSLDLPDSLQSVFLARIDRLSPEERYVLQLAAVIGRVFWAKVLAELIANEEEEVPQLFQKSALPEYLTSLQRTQLIAEGRRTPDLGREYIFQTPLVHDAVYESLLTTRKKQHHLRVAEYLEEILDEDARAQYYGLIAYHYSQAGEHECELSYTLLAAKQAKRIYANAEALGNYTRALELLDEVMSQDLDQEKRQTIYEKKFQALNGRRELLFRMGNFEQGQAEAQALLALAREMGENSAWVVDALLKQPGVAGWVNRKELHQGIPLAEEALSIAQQLGDRRRELHCLVAIANQRLSLNDPTGWELSEHALNLARELGDQLYEIGILTKMGQVYSLSEQPERGMPYLETALPLSRELGDRIAEANLLRLIALQFERDGDYDRFLTAYQHDQLRISREINHRLIEASALMHCGQIQGSYLGDYEGGLVWLDESLQIWRGTQREVFIQLRIAQIQIARERYEEALDALERADRIMGEHSREHGQVGLHLVHAILHNAMGGEIHWRKAIERSNMASQLALDVPLTTQYGMAAACKIAFSHLSLAKVVENQEERQTHLRQALEASRRALDIFYSFGFVHIIECVSEEIFFRHSQALAANGRQDEAAEYLQRAYDEMMRKYNLIPRDSHFRQTYLENIPLHREISAAKEALPIVKHKT